MNQIGNTIVSWIPSIIQAVIILIVGYIVALAIKAAVIGLLKRVGLNRKAFESNEGSWIRKITDDPARLIGNIVYWIIWILVVTIAIPVLNVPAFNQIVFAFYSYLPNVIAAILILTVAIIISAALSKLVGRVMGDTPTGRIVMTIGPGIIMTIAVFMVLVQLGIATPIVVITYTALIGALALGFALAFGLGGRELAAKVLEEAYEKGRRKMDQARSDMDKARERTGRS